MKRAKILAKSVALVCLGAAGAAQAGMYVGVGGGAVRLDPEVSNGITLEDDGRDTGLKAVIGKRIGRKSSVELYYADLGEATFTPAAEVGYTSYGINTVWDVWGGGHRSKKPAVFISLGLGTLETEDGLEGQNISSDREDDLVVNAGIGATFNFHHGMSLRTTLEVFDRDASMASAMLVKLLAVATVGIAHTATNTKHTKNTKAACIVGPRKEMDSVQSAPEVKAEAVIADAAVSTPVVERKKTDVKDLAQLQSVYFNRDSAFITDSSVGVLDQLLETMTDYPEMRVEIQGHTDAAEAGSARALSELRAQRVSNYLWQKGISPKRLALIAYGASQPAAAETR